MYPFIFNNVYKDYIWGGRNLEEFGKKLPAGIVAESWEVSCHPDGLSTVINGPLTGRTLAELVNQYPKEIIGYTLTGRFNNVFPLLIKFIDAKNKLSVQVHPDDDYALKHENENGKNEIWYILSAQPGSGLIYDVKKNIEPGLFKSKLLKGELEDCLNFVKVETGNVIYIPAGLIHAIGEGIVLLEIQQNSNSTYRVYDYNRLGNDRKPRPLHIDKAMDVIDFNNAGRRAVYTGLNINGNGFNKKILAASSFFCVELWEINFCAMLPDRSDRFYILTCLDGSCDVVWKDTCVKIEKGMSCLVPAICNQTFIKGTCTCMVSYLPLTRNEIITPLIEAGYDQKEIYNEIPGLLDFKI